MAEISDYITLDNPMAGLSWFESIIEKFEMLTEFPEIGRDISEVRKGVRALSVKNYLVFYSFQKPNIKILRIIHGARDWEHLF